jgi:hypothetical protein
MWPEAAPGWNITNPAKSEASKNLTRRLSFGYWLAFYTGITSRFYSNDQDNCGQLCAIYVFYMARIDRNTLNVSSLRQSQ